MKLKISFEAVPPKKLDLKQVETGCELTLGVHSVDGSTGRGGRMNEAVCYYMTSDCTGSGPCICAGGGYDPSLTYRSGMVSWRNHRYENHQPG